MPRDHQKNSENMCLKIKEFSFDHSKSTSEDFKILQFRCTRLSNNVIGLDTAQEGENNRGLIRIVRAPLKIGDFF